MMCSGAWGQSATAASPTYPPDIQKIKDRGHLIVAMHSIDQIPYVMSDSNGKLSGNDVDLARAIADELKVGITFDRTAKTFNEIVDIVASGKADIGLSTLSRTLARAEKVRFSNPYAVVRPVLVLNRVAAAKLNLGGSLSEMASFSGLIGEPKGNSYIGFAKSVSPKATVVELDTWDETFNAVTEGRVVATFRDEIGVKNYLNRYPERSVQLSMISIDNPAMADGLAIAVNSQSLQLLGFINLYLEMKYPTRKADDLMRIYAQHYKK
jgi:ABC-type amino acid transport substrate-binding protein